MSQSPLGSSVMKLALGVFDLAGPRLAGRSATVQASLASIYYTAPRTSGGQKWVLFLNVRHSMKGCCPAQMSPRHKPNLSHGGVWFETSCHPCTLAACAAGMGF